MNKKFFIAWAATFVVWMVGSFLVHGALLSQDYAKLIGVFRTPEDSNQYFPLMVLSHVMLAGVFVWIYTRGMQAKPWLAQGLRFGLLICLLAVIPPYTIYFVVQPMPAVLAVKQIVFVSILHLVLGAVVAWLYRNEKSA